MNKGIPGSPLWVSSCKPREGMARTDSVWHIEIRSFAREGGLTPNHLGALDIYVAGDKQPKNRQAIMVGTYLEKHCWRNRVQVSVVHTPCARKWRSTLVRQHQTRTSRSLSTLSGSHRGRCASSLRGIPRNLDGEAQRAQGVPVAGENVACGIRKRERVGRLSHQAALRFYHHDPNPACPTAASSLKHMCCIASEPLACAARLGSLTGILSPISGG